VRKALEKRKPIHIQKSGIISGKIICSVVEAKNLGTSKAVDKEVEIKPYVKISTEVHKAGYKIKPVDDFETRKATASTKSDNESDIRKLATWRSKDDYYDPTGHTVDLGEFTMNTKTKTNPIDARRSGFGNSNSLVLSLERMGDESVT
jgi:hypothetical protein